MKKYFNYNRSTDAFNDIIEGALELARTTDKKTPEYLEKVRVINSNIAQFCVEGTVYADRYAEKGLEIFKSSMVNKNQNVRNNFNIILSETIRAYIPEVANDIFSSLIAEVRQIGYGDTAKFDVESNDLFKVNQKAEGIQKGVDQPLFDKDFTVNPSPIEISTYIDWYLVAAGQFDIGSWTAKLAASFMSYIFIRSVKGLAQAATQFGNGYTANGVSPDQFGVLKQKVEAANGGMSVVAVGTEVALSKLSLGGNYQVQIGEEMNKVGYLDQYLSTPILALKNALVPGTINTSTPTLVLPNNKIYLIPVAGDRPVKIVFEGDEVVVEADPYHYYNQDKRYGIVITMRVGIGVIAGAKYGTITVQ